MKITESRVISNEENTIWGYGMTPNSFQA